MEQVVKQNLKGKTWMEVAKFRLSMRQAELRRSSGRDSNLKTMKAERGFTLIELLVGMVIFAVIAVAFLMAVNTAMIASYEANVRTKAKSLATSQMETIKNGPYIQSQNGTASYDSTFSTMPSGYMFNTLDANGNLVDIADGSGNPTNNNIYGVPVDSTYNNNSSSDLGIQRITIIVESDAEPNSHGVYKQIFTLIDFKVNR
jgi:prepilin-type N-terminal cleavage/methylation domain-containing protein